MYKGQNHDWKKNIQAGIKRMKLWFEVQASTNRIIARILLNLLVLVGP